MATPGELVHTVAKVLGIPQATIVQYDRNLAAAGLRTKSGRGPSAAQVTSEDAANLLIAICGAPASGAAIKEAVETCERYRLLQAYGVNSKSKSGPFARLKLHCPTLGRLPERHEFGRAIAALIDSVAAGEFGYPRDPFLYPYVSVRLDGPTPAGAIFIDFRRKIHVSYRKSDDFQPDQGDFRQERRFGFATLQQIATLVGSRIGPISDDKYADRMAPDSLRRTLFGNWMPNDAAD
jgi:hypothetical protein